MSNQSFTLLNTDLTGLSSALLKMEYFMGIKAGCSMMWYPPSAGLYFIRSGNAYIGTDGHRCPLLPGRMYPIPAGSRYNYVCTLR